MESRVKAKIDDWLRSRFSVGDTIEIIENGKKISEYSVAEVEDKYFLDCSKKYYYSPYYSPYYIMWELIVKDLQWRLKK